MTNTAKHWINIEYNEKQWSCMEKFGKICNSNENSSEKHHKLRKEMESMWKHWNKSNIPEKTVNEKKTEKYRKVWKTTEKH